MQTREKSKPDPEAQLALRVNDAVAQCGLSRSSIYKLISAGKLRNVVVAGRRLVLRQDILNLLEEAASNTADGAAVDRVYKKKSSAAAHSI